MTERQVSSPGPTTLATDELLPIAYRSAARVLRRRLLVEEAGERAVHLLLLATLQGTGPEHPKAWVRRVAYRSACALLRSDWSRTHSADLDEIDANQAPYRQPRPGVAFVREHLGDHLDPHLKPVLQAAVTCNGTRAAARSCGLAPRDFRRRLDTISRRARAMLQHGSPIDPFADEAMEPFALAP